VEIGGVCRYASPDVTHYGDLIWQHRRAFHLALIATPQTNG
jgi:hypothetical protein